VLKEGLLLGLNVALLNAADRPDMLITDLTVPTSRLTNVTGPPARAIKVFNIVMSIETIFPGSAS
jgi:hypothetical protein